MRVFKILCCAVALAAFTAPSAHADEWNKKTFLTFSGPVQVPGTTLPAGTYMFKLADLETNRHVVQIFDKDGGKLIATFLTVADYKLDPPKDNVVMFQERPRGMAQAIQAWWYVGDKTGDEFVYPKTQAFKIAKATHRPVLAMSDDRTATSTDAMKGKKIGRAQENGEMVAENDSPTAPRGTEAPASTVTTASRSQANTATSASPSSSVGTSGSVAKRTRTRTQLPRTASSLGLLELLAAASLLGAAGVRQLRRRLDATL